MTRYLRHLLLAVLLSTPVLGAAVVATTLLALLTSTTRTLPGLVTVHVTDDAREFALAFQFSGQGIIIALLALSALVGLAHLAFLRRRPALR